MVLVGNRKDIIELDELSDDCLKVNFGYTDAGIENLRDQANDIKTEKETARKDLDEYLGILIAEKFVLDRDDEVA